MNMLIEYKANLLVVWLEMGWNHEEIEMKEI